MGLPIWIAVLIVVDATATSTGVERREVAYLIAAALTTLALIMLSAFVQLADSPPELRTLRILAVLLPSAFVLTVEVILYFIEIDRRISEVAEHVVGAAILSVGAVPFSVYVFRSFTRLRNELAQRAQHLQALHGASMSVSGEPVRSRLRDQILESARSVASADRAILLLEPSQHQTEILLPQPPDGCGASEQERLLAQWVAASGTAVRCVEDSTSLLGVPLRLRGRPIGALAVARDSGVAFGEEDELVLDMFAVAASSGIENSRRLEEAQVLATVEERERIARELHDDMGQLLGFLTAKIQAAQELIATGRTERAREQLAGLEEATRTLSAQVREAILGLRARLGPDRPLGAALEDYVADFGIQAGLQTLFEGGRDTGQDLPGAAQYQVLRIAQEALSNARRHARASRVVVSLEECDDHLALSVADDGVGFVPGGDGPGFGLRTMAERARSLEASFQVRSAPGSGTAVALSVPMAQR